jgi:nicotinate-nucleotide adenylyltransferase
LNKPPRIGLLGGSFNPAHPGHLHISRKALDRLRLDEIWWLVTPQNPLKDTAGMAPLAERMAGARRMADDPRITVSDMELELGTRYSVHTMAALKQRFPAVRFVWIMGADVFLELPRWEDWKGFLRSVPIVVFPRPGCSRRALGSKAARRFRRHRVDPKYMARLARMRPPTWLYLEAKPQPISGTRLRARQVQGDR